MFRVGITGGIGSGKSTVCRLFAERGVLVYNSDAEAKRLMNESPRIRELIIERFGEGAYVDGVLNREYLADAVFYNDESLLALNAIVHPAVMRDFMEWGNRQSGEYVIFESAILFESGMDFCVDYKVAVIAPELLRLERVCRRDGVDVEMIKRRMAKQWSDEEIQRRSDFTLVNIYKEDLQEAVAMLDKQIKKVIHRNDN